MPEYPKAHVFTRRGRAFTDISGASLDSKRRELRSASFRRSAFKLRILVASHAQEPFGRSPASRDKRFGKTVAYDGLDVLASKEI